MEIVKCHFVFFMTTLSMLGSETVAYGAGRIRREFESLKDDMPFIRKDITELFDKNNQPNISAVEGCGPCISVNRTICPPVMDHDGRQNKAFVSEKINRELQDQLQSVKDILSANNKSAHERDRQVQDQLRSMEDTISESNKVANDRDRQVQDQLQSMRESIEDLHNNITSFMTTISDRIDEHLLQSRTTVKPEITTVPVIIENCTTVPESGVYTLYLEFMSIFTVYCDQDTDGGRWIVFLRRQDGSVSFFRPWVDYKLGFRSPDGEVWAGNELLYKLTKERPLQLRIDMEDFDGNTAFAMYDEFQVGAEEEKYRLHVSGYSGTAGDSLIDTSNATDKHAGMQFSTFDSDNDNSDDGNCAEWLRGGWWYNDCGDAFLTAPYNHNKFSEWHIGIFWDSWKGWYEVLKRVEIKIR